MKKYVKPMIMLERYELSQNIADCAWELQQNSQNDCTAIPDDDFFFGAMNGTLFSHEGCTYRTDIDYEDYCYQAGTSSPFNVFQS